MWSILTFGKHKGKSLPQVILHDPDYFFWAVEEGVFDRGRFVEEACLLEYRATNIEIPRPNPRDWCVRYTTDRNGKFAGFDIIEVTTPSQLDSIEMWREECLDLSAPRRFKQYDKLGCRLLLRNFKYYIFGSRDVRLTKQKCEKFFSNQSNFVLPVGKLRMSLVGPFAERDQPNSWEGLLAANREKGRLGAEEEGSLEGLFDFGSDLPTDSPSKGPSPEPGRGR
jgi:hypothetical protein